MEYTMEALKERYRHQIERMRALERMEVWLHMQAIRMRQG